MYNVKSTKLNVRSKAHVVTEEQLSTLFCNTKGKDKVLIVLLGYMGFREGEATHMKKWWLHVDDSDVKKYEIAHISIPESQKCGCTECRLRAYQKYRKEKRTEKKLRTKKWYAKVSKKFYKLHSKDKLPILNAVWKPKTEAGVRRVPFLVPETMQCVINYFEEHKDIGMKRFQVWNRIQKLGEKYLDKKIFPHSLRASFCTHLSNKLKDGVINIFNIKDAMGHEKIDTTDKYVESKSLLTLASLKKAYKL